MSALPRSVIGQYALTAKTSSRSVLRPLASMPAAPIAARWGAYSALLPDAPRIDASAPPPLVPLTTIRSALPGIAASLRRR